MSTNEIEHPRPDDSEEPAPAHVGNDGSAATPESGHQTGGGHDGMGQGPTGS